jgi:DNA-binding response OmpR family regulator
MTKILLIEDDTDTLDLLEYILADLSFEMHTAKQIIPLSEIIAINPDIILIDWNLPNGNGDATCREIKNSKPTEHIKVIMISTHSNLRKIARDACADAYIEKPFDIDHLSKIVSQFG